MIRLIDAYSYNNNLRSLSPMWKSGFAAALFLISYLSFPVIQAAVFIWISVWIIVYAGIPASVYLKPLGVAGVFFMTSIPALVLEIRNTSLGILSPEDWILFTLSHWTVYVIPSSIGLVGSLGMRIAACSSCLLFVVLTTPVSELFQVAKKLRIPNLVLELMHMIYRFLFLLLDTAADIYTSQQARGGYRGFRNKLADTAMLLARLFEKTMQRYKEVSYGLIARGFTEEIPLAAYQASPTPPRYVRECLIGISILMIATIWKYWRLRNG